MAHNANWSQVSIDITVTTGLIPIPMCPASNTCHLTHKKTPVTMLLQPLVVPPSSSTVKLQALCPAAGEDQPSWGPVVEPEVAKARRPPPKRPNVLGVFTLPVDGLTCGLDPSSLNGFLTFWLNAWSPGLPAKPGWALRPAWPVKWLQWRVLGGTGTSTTARTNVWQLTLSVLAGTRKLCAAYASCLIAGSSGIRLAVYGAQTGQQSWQAAWHRPGLFTLQQVLHSAVTVPDGGLLAVVAIDVELATLLLQ